MEVEPPRLYNNPGSFYSQRVILALAEKGIPFKSKVINLGQFEHYSDWYMEINPKGQVPVLEDDGKFICGSGEIIKYLDKVYEGVLLMPQLGQEKWEHFQKKLDEIQIEVLTFGPALFPHLVKDCIMPLETRERMSNALMKRQRSTKLRELHASADPKLQEIYKKKLDESIAYEEVMSSENCVKEEIEKTRQILTEINAELKDKIGDNWLCGPDFTVADVYLAVLLQRLKLSGYAAELWEDGFLPYLEAYYGRLLTRNTFRSVCVKGVSVVKMLTYVYGVHGSIAVVLASISALIIAVWLGFYMVGKI